MEHLRQSVKVLTDIPVERSQYMPRTFPESEDKSKFRGNWTLLDVSPQVTNMRFYPFIENKRGLCIGSLGK